MKTSVSPILTSQWIAPQAPDTSHPFPPILQLLMGRITGNSLPQTLIALTVNGKMTAQSIIAVVKMTHFLQPIPLCRYPILSRRVSLPSLAGLSTGLV
jgi:hypothetical protein